MLFEIVLEASLFGQQVINRYNFVSTSTPAAVSRSFGLVGAFGALADGLPAARPVDGIFELTRAVQQGNLNYVQISAKNIYDLADFYSTPFESGVIGAVTATQCLSPMIAFGLHTTQVTRAVRRGQKRIAGVPEGSSGEGGVITSGVLTELETLCDAMSNPITFDDEGTTLTYVPVIVSKEPIVLPSGNTTYRYYETLAEQETHLAEGCVWSPMTTTRSQRSRQYGIGS